MSDFFAIVDSKLDPYLTECFDCIKNINELGAREDVTNNKFGATVSKDTTNTKRKEFHV
jgi:hypothetical protein